MNDKVIRIEQLFSMDAESRLASINISRETHDDIYYSPKPSEHPAGLLWPYRTIETATITIDHGECYGQVEYLILATRFVVSLRPNSRRRDHAQNAPGVSIYLNDIGALHLAKLLGALYSPYAIEPSDADAANRYMRATASFADSVPKSVLEYNLRIHDSECVISDGFMRVAYTMGCSSANLTIATRIPESLNPGYSLSEMKRAEICLFCPLTTYRNCEDSALFKDESTARLLRPLQMRDDFSDKNLLTGTTWLSIPLERSQNSNERASVGDFVYALEQCALKAQEYNRTNGL